MRSGGRVIGATAALLALSAGPAAAIAGPRPGADTFFGTITSTTGRYAGDHGRVVIKDAAVVSRASGQLVVSGASCRGAPHCLSLAGRPVGALKLKGHPIPDAGYTFTVSGSGRVAPLGWSRSAGCCRSPGSWPAGTSR